MIDQGQKSPQPRVRPGGINAGEISMPSVRDVLRVAFRHKWLILSVFAIVSVAGAGFVMTIPNVYQSEGRMMLRDQRSALAIDPAKEGLVTGSERFGSGTAISESAILSSPDLADEVAKAIGPERVLSLPAGKTIAMAFAKAADPADAAQKSAAKVLQKSMTIQADGQIISVLYTHTDPLTAHDILDKILTTYQTRHIAAYSSSASPELLRAKAEELRLELDTKKDELANYQTKHNVTSVIRERELVEAQLKAFEADLAKARVDKDASKAKISLLEPALKSRGGDIKIGPSEVLNPDVLALEDQLRDLSAEKIRLEAKYVDSPELRANRTQIDAVHAKIKTLPATVPRQLGGASAADPGLLLENARVEYGSFVAREESLTKELEKAQARLRDLRQSESDGMNLETEVKHLTDRYWASVSGLDQAEQSAALDRERVSNVSVVQPATVPNEPIAPRRTRMIAMILFAGLATGLGLAFVREFFDDTVKSRDEAETKLGLTVLAVVPEREFRKCI
jgi:uncharacterized protein involved in exopolysaccharide biosynthesis